MEFAIDQYAKPLLASVNNFNWFTEEYTLQNFTIVELTTSLSYHMYVIAKLIREYSRSNANCYVCASTYMVLFIKKTASNLFNVV